jgi:hypothetical protein
MPLWASAGARVHLATKPFSAKITASGRLMAMCVFECPANIALASRDEAIEYSILHLNKYKFDLHASVGRRRSGRLPPEHPACASVKARWRSYPDSYE